LRARWNTLQPRERLLLGGGGALLALTLAWLLLLSPALNVLATAPAQIERFERQKQRMQALAADAATLREQASAVPEDRGAAVQATARVVLGDRANLTLGGEQIVARIERVRGDELMSWLSQVRSNARLTPDESSLEADAAGLWKGSVTFRLPPEAR